MESTGTISNSCFICRTLLSPDNSPPQELFQKSNISFALTVCEIFQLAYDPENQDLFQNNPISCTDCFLEILKINRLINDLRSIQDKLEDAKQEVKNKILENQQDENQRSAESEVSISLSQSKIAQNKIIDRLRNRENVICEPEIDDIHDSGAGAREDYKLFTEPVDNGSNCEKSKKGPIITKHKKKVTIKPKKTSKSLTRTAGKPEPIINFDGDTISDLDVMDDEDVPDNNGKNIVQLEASVSTGPTRRVNSTTIERPSKRNRKIDNPDNDNIPVKKKRTRTRLIKGSRKVIYCTQPGCTASYDSLYRIKELRIHEANVHGLLFQCDKCENPQRAFKFKDMLKRHIREIHENISNFTCTYCKKGFYIKSEHDLHVNTIHKKEFNHLCNECGKRFVNKRNLTRHEERHRNRLLPASEKEKFKVICEVCAKTLCDRGSLAKHMRRYHNIGQPLQICSTCGKGFITNALLENHNLIHTLPDSEIGEKPWKCTLCPKSYTREDVLHRHIQAYHISGGEFICKYDSCGKQFSNANLLTNHEKEIHEQVFNHFCEICNRGFYLKSKMLNHMKNHPGIFSYKCNFCDKMFSSEQNRRRHENSNHKTEDLKFKCTICQRKLLTKSEWLKHTARHNKNHRPFICDCGATFKVKSDLNRHKNMKRSSCVNPLSTKKIAIKAKGPA